MPPPIKPMLGDLELSLVQGIETIEEQVLVDHAVPGLAGNFTQQLNRKATQVTLRGVITGDEAQDGLEKLREKFHAAEPLPFVADIMTATEVQQMLIADVKVQELAGKSDRFAYQVTLSEYITPLPDAAAEALVVGDRVGAQADEIQETTENQVEAGQGILEVTVDLSDPDSDLSQVQILVQGETEEGQPYRVVLDQQTNGVFRKSDMPAGQYTVSLMRR